MRKKKFDLYTFLSGDAPDAKGRYYNGILQQSDEWLEHCHDYIQEIFPTDEPSMFVLHAPIVTIEDANKWSQNIFIRQNMKYALERMIKFYSTTNRFGKYFWVEKQNHNYRRVSRILRSLRLFGLDDEADMFYEFVNNIADENPNVVNADTRAFWAKNNERIMMES